MRVGLTGGIASGKSTAAAELRRHGVCVIDYDQLAHDVIAPGTSGAAVVAGTFGPGVLTAAGELDRVALGRRVFASADDRRRLEAIVHPLVYQAAALAEAAARAAGEQLIVHEIPLLAEVMNPAGFDLVIVVDAPAGLRAGRLVEGRGLTPSQAAGRLGAQAGDEQRRAVAGLVWDGSGPPERLQAQVVEWLQAVLKPGLLIVVRHGESEYNAQDIWTGTTDVGLTPAGHDDARRMGEQLRDLSFDRVYTSCLKRAVQSRDDLLAAHGPVTALLKKTAALNERDYGDYTGLDKWQVRETVGDQAFTDLRRSFDAVIPNGESLRDVSERVVPWYRENIVPRLLQGENILIVGHGNSDRALRKYLENISDEAVKDLEMDFDKIYLYRIGPNGRSLGAPELRQLS